MYISTKASRIRQNEAERARKNRAEIVKARSIGQVSRRDLMKWGVFTASGLLVCKNGLSPFARSAFADIPTGTPRSPLFGAQKFTQPLPRLNLHTPVPMTPVARDGEIDAAFGGQFANERSARRMSYHNDFNAYVGDPAENPFRNPLTNRGPIEGRPPTEFFAHQRWNDFFPKAGYVTSWGQIQPGTKFHPNFPDQDPNAVWSYGPGAFAQGIMAPPLFKLRYGEPVLMRVYNNTPVNREENGGFGRNEQQFHFHNAHNGAESDGATGAHHFPGTFYDYLWGTALARSDLINQNAADPKASGPDGNGGLVNVPGDFRELQGTLWAHDHRFFFTAENVYKGNLSMVNLYSGRDRGNEQLNDGVNLRLPSGKFLDYGNVDFDVNLIISDGATDQDGQYFFDVFTTDGFLGDIPLVNFAYAPYMEVLPRKYRFRILPGAMSRFWQLVFAAPNATPIAVKQIANDGNFLVNPVVVTTLDIQGVAERFDVIVDFTKYKVGEKIKLVNLLQMRDDGRGPTGPVTLAQALAGVSSDPCIGPIMEFRVVSSVPSVDAPGQTLTTANSCGVNDKSQVPLLLTQQVPIVAPVRTRTIEWGRSGTNGDSRDPNTGECTPDCPEHAVFPWSVKINGESAHTFNANRISLVVPRPGEVEHWTFVNGGGGWDHPIHLHFEEAVTMNRGGAPIPTTERNVRKDVWRLRDGGTVQIQVRFGEFGGAYVNHCHNTVHEDFAMLMRYQLLAESGPQAVITPTPNPTPDGVFFTTPEILPEGDPRSGA